MFALFALFLSIRGKAERENTQKRKFGKKPRHVRDSRSASATSASKRFSVSDSRACLARFITRATGPHDDRTTAHRRNRTTCQLPLGLPFLFRSLLLLSRFVFHSISLSLSSRSRSRPSLPLTAMQPRNIVRLEPSKREVKVNKPTVLQKVARGILALAPIRSSKSNGNRNRNNTPTPIPLSSSESLSSTSTPDRLSPSPPGPQSPPYSFNNHHTTLQASPSPSSAPFVPPEHATPTTSSIHRRRGAIVELPNEWYAKGERYNALAFACTQTAERVEAEPVRRAKSYQAPLPPPTQSVRSVGVSVLGGVRRGKSAQAALGIISSPTSNPARPEEREQHQEGLDWMDSLGFTDDVAISFDFEEELDQAFMEL